MEDKNDCSNYVFVFGSNLAGRHGAGSAKAALKYFGAILGKGVGLQGRSYAIPTKDYKLETLDLWAIELYVIEFLEFAREHPELWFDVMDVGCGLAGYKAEQIAPMFKNRPKNVNISNNFKKVLDKVL